MNEATALIERCAPAVDARTMKKIGHITPSTNTTVEPLTTLLALLDGGRVTQHFSRISVKRLALDGAAEDQFQVAPMLAAARLLGEAPLDVIAWNGTSGGWLGFAHDRAIVDAIEAETGIRATTTTLAMETIYRRAGWSRIAIVCPYTNDVAGKIADELARHGFEVAATSNLGLVENVDMGNAAEATIRDQLRAVAAARPDGIAVICTNLSAAPSIDAFEREYGIPVVDSIAATFVEASRMCGVDVRIAGLGRLLAGTL